MIKGLCSVNDCGRVERLRHGMCGMHYRRCQKTGDPGPAGRMYEPSSGVCAVLDCEKPIRRPGGVPYCGMHYKRLRVYGSLTAHARSVRGVCGVEECGGPAKQEGMCAKHFSRFKRHGSPYVVISPSERRTLRGADSPRWLSDDVLDYRTMHMRMRRINGSAKTMPCVDCGLVAVHWAYDHLDPEERTTPEGVPFSIDPGHYQPRCASCHKVLDNAYLRREAIRCALAELLSAAEESSDLITAEFIASHLAAKWPRFPESASDLVSGVGGFLVRTVI